MNKQDRPEGALLIVDERARQMGIFPPELDRARYADNDELLRAAMAYMGMASAPDEVRDGLRAVGGRMAPWPWGSDYWKPSATNTNQARIRELEKAGALIAAHIDILIWKDAQK